MIHATQALTENTHAIFDQPVLYGRATTDNDQGDKPELESPLQGPTHPGHGLPQRDLQLNGRR